MSHRDDHPGKTQDMLEGLHLTAGLGTPTVAGKGSLAFSAFATPATLPQIQQQKMDGWKDDIF